MARSTFIFLTFFLTGFCLSGQNIQEISVPVFNDRYSELVKQLEAGKTDIDYREFRDSFIESRQFVVASKMKTEFDKLKKEMFVQLNNSNSQEVLSITKAMLSIDYTNILAHKILRQTYNLLGDTLNAQKYRTIQFGLLNSIVKNGDGTSFKTAWHVIQVNEEYFILQMLGVEVLKQSLIVKDGKFDKMDVKTEDGDTKSYYFDVSKVFEGYDRQRIK